MRRLAFCLLTPAFFFCLPPSRADAHGAWTRQRSGTLAWLHAVHFVDEKRGWAVGGKGVVLATTDGGKNWESKRAPTDDVLRDVFFVSAETGWLLCERNFFAVQSTYDARSYLMKTTDGGRTWARVALPAGGPDATLLRIVFAGAQKGWVFGESGVVFATSDGGGSWARQRVPTERLLLGGAFLDDRTGWLVGPGSTFLYTADGGEAWRAGALISAASDSELKTGTAARAAASSTPAARTQSVAAEKSSAASRARLHAVTFVNERRGWAVGVAGALFSTANGGRTWRALAPRTEADLFDVKFLDEREGWAVGSGGVLLHTRDGGEQWDAWPSGTTHALERLFFVGRTRGWAVGFGGTIMSYAPDDGTDAPKLRGVARRDP